MFHENIKCWLNHGNTAPESSKILLLMIPALKLSLVMSIAPSMLSRILTKNHLESRAVHSEYFKLVMGTSLRWNKRQEAQGIREMWNSLENVTLENAHQLARKRRQWLFWMWHRSLHFATIDGDYFWHFFHFMRRAKNIQPQRSSSDSFRSLFPSLWARKNLLGRKTFRFGHDVSRKSDAREENLLNRL